MGVLDGLFGDDVDKQTSDITSTTSPHVTVTEEKNPEETSVKIAAQTEEITTEVVTTEPETAEPKVEIIDPLPVETSAQSVVTTEPVIVTTATQIPEEEITDGGSSRAEAQKIRFGSTYTINVSRGILYKDPELSFAEKAEKWATLIRSALAL